MGFLFDNGSEPENHLGAMWSGAKAGVAIGKIFGVLILGIATIPVLIISALRKKQ